MRELVTKGLISLKEKGVRHTVERAANSIVAGVNRRADHAYNQRYDEWIRRFDTLTEGRRQNLAGQLNKFEYCPLISVLMPVYNTPEIWLRRALESVQKQLYPEWELCIADDASTEIQVREILEEYAASDSRLKIHYRSKNGHISAASNSALGLAGGEFVALLDHDDELHELALYYVVAELNDNSNTDLLYTDEDSIDADGVRASPHFKSDWNPDLLLSQNYINHMTAYRTSIVRETGGFREGFEGSQDYDLLLRVSERIPPSYIRHIPRVLYHWRSIPGSVAQGESQKDYSIPAAVSALTSHLERTQREASAKSLGHHRYRINYRLPATLPRVSIVVFSAGDVADVEKITTNTSYSNYDTLVLSQSSNASSLNEAAKRSAAEILLFLDGACSPDNADWLQEMVNHAIRPEIGVTGARLLDSAGRIVHAGMILGAGDGRSGKVAQSAFHELKSTDRRVLRLGRSQLVQNFSAVSRSCLMIRRKLFEELEGFDETNTPNTFYDIDLCLRLVQAGYRVLVTPFAIMKLRAGKSTRSTSKAKENGLLHAEHDYMHTRWGSRLGNDPYYNPNLDLTRPWYELAFPPRVPPLTHQKSRDDNQNL
jgi:cellulose synthase/poly-beta-1,6-N-acetylglucosamine synthase-like glycosyltransferase